MEYIKIKTKTWDQNKENLFDYENSSYKKNSLVSNTEHIDIYRNTQNCFISEANNERKDKPILSISNQEKKLKIKFPEQEIWNVVPSSKNQISDEKYILHENDVIKLGRIEIDIVEFRSELEENIFNAYITLNNFSNIEEKICKICYETRETEKNPLLSLCHCQGSLKYAHLNCSKKWLKNRIKILEKMGNFYIKFDISSFKCEICSAFLNVFYRIEGKQYFIIDEIKEFKNYLILKQGLTLIVFDLSEKKEIVIGRGVNSCLKLDDSTVSRIHCKIFFNEKNLCIEDCNSKFGTLVKLKKSIIIEDVAKIYNLQANNNLIKIKKTKRKKNFLGLCFCGCV